MEENGHGTVLGGIFFLSFFLGRRLEVLDRIDVNSSTEPNSYLRI